MQGEWGDNPAIRKHLELFRQKAMGAINRVNVALQDPLNPANLEEASLSAKNCVVDRLQFHQIFTEENYMDWKNMRIGDRTPAKREDAKKKMELLRYFYERQAVHIAGKDNWERIRDSGGAFAPKLTHFHFNDEGENWWGQYLNYDIKTKKSIADSGFNTVDGHVNKGKRYIGYNIDDVMYLASEDTWAKRELPGNKPGKSPWSDLVAAQKDSEAVMEVFKNPFSKEAWGKLVGSHADYNDREAEIARNEKIVDAVVSFLEGAFFIRNFVPEPIAGWLTAALPFIKSDYESLFPHFHNEASFAEYIAQFINEKVGMGVIDFAAGERIKKKHKLGMRFGSYVTNLFMYLFLYLTTHPEALTGMEDMKM